MNILQIAAYCADFPGNFIFSLLCIGEKIQNEGGKVVYAFPDEARSKSWCIELQKRSKVFFLPLSRARLNWKTYIKIRKICQDEKIDIIHSHFELYDIPCLFTSKKIKIVWHLHDAIGGEKGLRSIIRKLQYRYLTKRIVVVAISDDDRKSLLKLGCPKEKIYVILNGISTASLSHIEIPKEYPIFLSMGWDYKRKGIDLIIEAAKRLREECQNFKLLINCREETIAQIQEQVDINDEWINIQLPQKNMSDIYSKANIFIQASRHETFSFAVCEASYVGLQLIISDIPGMEWARKFEKVRIFENENVDDLYCRMKEIVEEFSKLSWEYPMDKRMIEEKYSTKRWANELYGVYEELLENESRT